MLLAARIASKCHPLLGQSLRISVSLYFARLKSLRTNSYVQNRNIFLVCSDFVLYYANVGETKIRKEADMNNDTITANAPHTKTAFDGHGDKRLPALELDYAEFLPMLGDLDISEEQKREFLETLASILWGFVEMGFNLSDADICGWIAEMDDPSLPADSDDASVEPSTVIDEESAQGGGE